MPLRLAAGKEQGMDVHEADIGSRWSTATALAAEYHAQKDALRRGDIPLAWRHLERAHILAQTSFVPHIISHWRMLRLAFAQRDWREAAGQVMRLALAPVGNLTRRLPIGNTGRSTVNAFAPMDVPSDLRVVLDRKSG